jgi:hypothetical protein
MPFVLVVFALMSILPAAMVPSSAIAQEEENLASSIVSEVLEDDGGGSSSSSSDAQDESNQEATNTASEDSNQQQDVDEDNVGDLGEDVADLDDANVAVPLGIPINVQLEEEVVVEPEPDDGELPPPEDEDVFFCLEDIDFGVLCFDTLQDCEFVEDLFEVFIVSECEEFETPPSDAAICRVVEEDPPDIVCEPDPF